MKDFVQQIKKDGPIVADEKSRRELTDQVQKEVRKSKLIIPPSSQLPFLRLYKY